MKNSILLLLALTFSSFGTFANAQEISDGETLDVNSLKVSFNITNILPVIGSYYFDAGDKINDSAIFLVPAR